MTNYTKQHKFVTGNCIFCLEQETTSFPSQ